jgi:predicted  nucleic acid-binding Zn-ribbon protein
MADREDPTVHVLTKVFVVLVSLLAVMLVPLVVVYAYNEDSFKARYQSAEQAKAAAIEDMKATQARAGSEVAAMQNEIDQLRTARTQLETNRAADQSQIRKLETDLAAANGLKTEIAAQLAMLATSNDAAQKLLDSLITELRQLRADTVAIERQKVELDEALRDVTGQLEVAVAARRALEEELARLKDEHSRAMSKLGEAYAKGFGDRDVVRVGIMPDKTLSAEIVRVERSNSQVLAEISAGSRDGVKKDWSMAISDSSGFVANLRIIDVDINRSTGIVTLEKSKVQVGQMAHALAGYQ